MAGQIPCQLSNEKFVKFKDLRWMLGLLKAFCDEKRLFFLVGRISLSFHSIEAQYEKFSYFFLPYPLKSRQSSDDIKLTANL